MPQIIDFEGYGLAEFPDDFTQEQIHASWDQHIRPVIEQKRFAASSQQKISAGKAAALQPQENGNWAGTKAAASRLGNLVPDTAIDLTKGVIGAGEAVVGLADLVSGGYAGKGMEAIGWKPRESKAILDTYISDAEQESRREVADTKGFWKTAAALAERPSTVFGNVVESVPTMIGGGALSQLGLEAIAKLGPKAAKWAATEGAAILAGAVGEGSVAAGQMAESARQQSADKLLDWKQVGYSVAAGLGTGGLGVVGGKAAKFFRVDDLQTMMARGALLPGAKLTAQQRVAKALGGALTEGVFEELPQSAQEQVWSNLSVGKPAYEGVAEAAATGMMAGMAMGLAAGGASKFNPNPPGPTQTQTQTGQPPPASTTQSTPVAPAGPANAWGATAGPLPINPLPQFSGQMLNTPIRAWAAAGQPHPLVLGVQQLTVGQKVVSLSDQKDYQGFGAPGTVIAVNLQDAVAPTAVIRFDNGKEITTGFKAFADAGQWAEAQQQIAAAKGKPFQANAALNNPLTTEFPAYPDIKVTGPFKPFSEALRKWEEAVREWLKSKPENKAIVWEESNGNVRALTRDTRAPWRVTTYYKRDNGAYMPAGHTEHKTREEALIEHATHGPKFLDKFPGKVMDEKEIKGYVHMKDVKPEDLHWYRQLAPNRLEQNKQWPEFMRGFVFDSLRNGNEIAWNRELDPREEKGFQLERVVAKEPVARPFQPDDILIAHSTFTDEDFEVSYRGPLGDDKSVVWTGKTQMTVPNSWLRRKGEPLVKKPLTVPPVVKGSPPVVKQPVVATPSGTAFTASTPVSNDKVSGVWTVIDAADIIASSDAGFDQALQPRDRSRVASKEQVAKIAAALDPVRLIESVTTDTGSPIIDDLNQAITGNGRIAALRMAYGAGSERSAAYKQHVIAEAARYGLDPEQVAAMQSPILVRRVTDYGKLSKEELARLSNESAVLGMSAAEQAGSDSAILRNNQSLMDAFLPSEEGDIFAATNRPFLNSFIQATGGDASLKNADGSYNEKTLGARVKNAVLGALIGAENRNILNALIDRANDLGIAKVSTALMQAAPALLKFKGTTYDVASPMFQALKDLVSIKEQGQKLNDFLSQSSLFADPLRTSETDFLLTLFADAKSAKSLVETFVRYAELASKIDLTTDDMFGTPPTPRPELLKKAYAQPTTPAQEQADLSFGKPPATPQKPAAKQPSQPADPSIPAEAPAPPVAPVDAQPEAPAAQPADANPSQTNTIDDELAAKIKARVANFRKTAQGRGGNVGSLLGGGYGQMFTDAVMIGVHYIEKGFHKFSDWSAKMTEDFGDWITDKLRSIYEIARVTIEAPRSESSQGRSPGLQPGLRPPAERIVTARESLTAKADESVIPSALVQHLDTHQRQGVAKAIASLRSIGGFLNADGTGAGKTRQALAVASSYSSQGFKVLIVTQSGTIKPNWAKNTFGGSYGFDSKAMGVPVEVARRGEVKPGHIGITTYENLEHIIQHTDKDTVLIFDEAHKLKNDSAMARFGMQAIARAKATMFMSATPADEAEHIYYLASIGIMEGKTTQQALRDLGMALVTMKKNVKVGNRWERRDVTFWAEDQRVSDTKRHQRLSELFDRMTANGSMIKREISMDGVHVQVLKLALPPEAHAKQQAILEFFDASHVDDLKGLAKAQALGNMRRQQEPFKIGPAVLLAKRELAAGRQVVIFISRVNYSIPSKWVKTVSPSGETEKVQVFMEDGGSEGTAKSMREALEDAGIHDIAEIHGNAEQSGLEAMADFQSGKKRVVIATIESGGTGINLDDILGNKPRSMIMVTAPFDAVGNVQAAGRIWRLKTLSGSNLFYLFGDTDVDDWNSSIIGSKMQLLGAVVEGQVRRLDVANPDLVTTDDYHDQVAPESAPVQGDPTAFPKLDWKPFTTKAGKQKFIAPATQEFWDWYNANGKQQNPQRVSVSKWQGEWQVWSDKNPNETSLESKVIKGRSTESAGMSPDAVQDHLTKTLGVQPGSVIQVINDPSKNFEAKIVVDAHTGQFIRIEMNAAHLTSTEQIDAALTHELSHGVWESGDFQSLIDTLTGKEIDGIVHDVTKSGYEQAIFDREVSARGIETLVKTWRGRSWFAKAVGMVQAWASSIGFKLSRKAAEYLAARALAKVKREVIKADQMSQLAKLPGAVVFDGGVLVPPGERMAAYKITAHHGTPHQVDKFSTSKIGTGEGAQVYGWGLYFAENRAVAKGYQEKLSGGNVLNKDVLERYFKPGSVVPSYGGSYDRVVSFDWNGGAWKVFVKEVRKSESGAWMDYGRERSHFTPPSEKQLAEAGIKLGPQGNLYTVEIHAEPDEILDWDSQIADQPAVRKHFQNRPSYMTGKELYWDIASDNAGGKEKHGKKGASELLASLGIKGIRYLDQGSRNIWTKPIFVKSENQWRADTNGQSFFFDTQAEAEGYLAQYSRTYNYVIFNGDDISITHANGQPVTAREAAKEQGNELSLFSLVPNEGPNAGQAEVNAASKSIQSAAQAEYAKLESAAGELDAQAYGKEQFRRARAEQNRLVELANGKILQMHDVPPDIMPDPVQGVGVDDTGSITVDDTFSDKLANLQVQHNPDNVKSMQAEIFFEQQAQRVLSARARLEKLEARIAYASKIGAPIKDIQRLTEQADKNRSDLATTEAVQHNGSTVGQRADEIDAAAKNKVDVQARHDALDLDPVKDFFGKGIDQLRDTMDQAKAAADLLEALRNTKTSITEFERLTEIYERWHKFPATVKDALVKGILTNEQFGAVVTSLQHAFIEFDLAKSQMDDLLASEQKPLIEEIEKQEAIFKKSNDDATEGASIIDAALQAAKGEAGFATAIGDDLRIDRLKAAVGAIAGLAKTLGENLSQNRWLYDYLAGYRATPGGTLVFSKDNADALLVSESVLRDVIKLVEKSPAFGSAIVALADDAAARAANSNPLKMAATVDTISGLLAKKDDAGAHAAAAALARSVQGSVKASSATQRAAAAAINRAVTRLSTLNYGANLFATTAANPAVVQARAAVNSGSSMVLPMIERGSDAVTYLPFGNTARIYSDGVVNSATENPRTVDDTKKKVNGWFEAAKEYIKDYQAAEIAHFTDPVRNPSTQALGYDRSRYLGLLQAVIDIQSEALDPSDPDSRVKVNITVRKLMKRSMARQYDFVSRLVGGVIGTAMRAARGKYEQGNLDARRVASRFQDLPLLQGRAMQSHGIQNTNNYRAIWNEMAGYGRMFSSPLKVGFKLPVSGAVVTQADMDFIRKSNLFEDNLRREVTETNSTKGVRVTVGPLTYVRPGGYVGDIGMPRHLSQHATTFIADVLAAYNGATQFTGATDLSTSGTVPVVKFWNRKLSMLKQHVLDSQRQDRTMKLDPIMARAEQAVARRWLAGHHDTVESLEDLARLIAAEIPVGAVVNPRDFVAKNLSLELNQYKTAAKEILDDRNKPSNRNSGLSVALSADNEFTKPAAELKLPHELYNYGALTSGERLGAQSRANHENIVEFANTIRRALTELRSRKTRFENGEITEAEAASDYGGNIKEMNDTIEILDASLQDFTDSFDMAKSLALSPSKLLSEAAGTLVRGVLALPLVTLNNLTLGQFQVFLTERAMGYTNGRMAAWNALTNIPKGLGRFAYASALNSAKFFDRNFTSRKSMEAVVDAVAAITVAAPAMLRLKSPTKLVQEMKSELQAVHDLGFDTSPDLFNSMKNAWAESDHFANRESEEFYKNHPLLHGSNRVAMTFLKSLNAALTSIGVENSDQVLNSLNIAQVDNLEKRFEQVAMKFGKRLTDAGITSIDPADKSHTLSGSEWTPFWGVQASKDSLGLMRQFIEGSAGAEGFQMEHAFLKFYQDKIAGKNPKMFTDRQKEAVQRSMLAQMNTSLPTNRASKTASSALWKNLLTLQGYPTDAFLKLLNTTLSGTRDRTLASTLIAKLPLMLSIALMAIAVGGGSDAAKEWWRRRMQNLQTSQPGVLDSDFWSDQKKFRAGITRYMLRNLTYIGDATLAVQNSIQGERNVSIEGRFWPISVGQSFARAIADTITYGFSPETRNEVFQPAKDLAAKYTPFAAEAINLIGANSDVKQGKTIASAAARQADIPIPKSGYGGGVSTPSTILKRRIIENIGEMAAARASGDTAGYEEAKALAEVNRDKLEAYYTRKRIELGDSPEAAAKNAKAAVYRDYQETNPVVAALGGRRPTDAEYQTIVSSPQGSRAEALQRSISAWNEGSQALFGRAGTTSKEEASAGRSGGGVDRESARLEREVSGGGRSSFGRVSTGGSRLSRGGLGRIRAPRVSLTRGRISSGRRIAGASRKFKSGLRAPRARKIIAGRIKRVRLTA